MQKLFDVHTHIHQHLDQGQHFVVSGYNQKTNKQAIEFAKTNTNAYFSLGLAPQEIQRIDLYPDFAVALEDVIKQIEEQKDNPQFVAVGEIGLDKHWGKTETDFFRHFDAFEKMILLAKRLDKPVVIHSRKAESSCIDQLMAAGCKRVIMHCFSGNLRQAKQCADLGWLISIPPQKSKERKKIIKELELDSFVVESDAPYIGKKSVDALKSAQMIADYRQIPIEKVLERTNENAKRIFDI